VLPPAVRDGVRQFFELQLRWLERTLRVARATAPRRDAHTVLSTLQGALCLALTLQDANVFDAAVIGVMAGLRLPRPRSRLS
jgi:hypothetical protein